LKVYDDDDLPKLLCPTCVAILETVEHFKEVCTRSVDSIRKLIIVDIKEEPVEEYVSAEMLQPILKVENEEVDEEERKFVVEEKMKMNRVPILLPKGVRPMCALCGLTFVNIKGIRKHMKLELKRLTEPKIELKKKPIREVQQSMPITLCAYVGCRRTFVNKNCLRSHLKKHANSKVSCFITHIYVSIVK
jgi:hypothetical protein